MPSLCEPTAIRSGMPSAAISSNIAVFIDVRCLPSSSQSRPWQRVVWHPDPPWARVPPHAGRQDEAEIVLPGMTVPQIGSTLGTRSKVEPDNLVIQ